MAVHAGSGTLDLGASSAPPTQMTLSRGAVRGILASLMLVTLLASLDSTVVATALPRIVSDLQGNEVYTWVFTIYLLTMTASNPMYASLSDRVGRKPIMLFGVGLFLIGSALCGVASEMWHLLLFRGIQGLGAGAIAPVAAAIIGDLFDPADRARYQPLLASVLILAFLIGPTMGGVITDSIGWNWIFYINIPLGLLALFVMWRTMPQLKPVGERHRFDILGVVAFAAAVVPFLVGLKNKADGEWTDPAVGGLMLLGLAIGALFVFIEWLSAEPIVPVRLFRDATFAVASTVILLSVAGLFLSITFLPRFFQFVHGASATESGWQIMTLLFGFIIGAIVGGQVVARTGRWKLLLLGGMALGVIGLVLLTTIRADSDLPWVWALMFVTGLGVGPVNSVLMAVVQTNVPATVMAVASGTLTFFRQLGASIWLAIGGTVFVTSFGDALPDRLAASGAPTELVRGIASGSTMSGNELTGLGDLGARILAALPEDARAGVEPYIAGIVRGVHEAFTLGIADTFWIGVAAIATAIVVLAFLRETPLPVKSLEEEPSTA